MKISRRGFCALAGLAAPFALAHRAHSVTGDPSPDTLLKPPRLRRGDTVGLISPGGAIFRPSTIRSVQRTLNRIGLNSVLGQHALKRRGYLAGADVARAADLNHMFADPRIDAVLALRGGWGCNRILPLLNYDIIRSNPKILMGYSDITSLLIALYARAGLVSFHGPVGISTWNDVTVDYVRRVLFEGESVTMTNPRHVGPPRVQQQYRTDTITPGKARGRLIGGNLSVLVSMIGSQYLPDWDDVILFLEDTDEDIYRIDRMLTQLSMADVLPRLAGVVFGKCTNCEAENRARSLTLAEVFEDHFKPLGIPCWYGAMIGHISDKFTVPVGVLAEIDASAGTITLLEAAVS